MPLLYSWWKHILIKPLLAHNDKKQRETDPEDMKENELSESLIIDDQQVPESTNAVSPPTPSPPSS